MLSFDAPASDDQRQDLIGVLADAGASVTTPFADGTEAVFRSATAALDGATAAQAWSRRADGVGLRVGVASGDVRWDGERCSGPAVLTAARLAERAGPGEILISHVVTMLTDGDCPTRPAGSVWLHGMTAPLDVDRVDWAAAASPGTGGYGGNGATCPTHGRVRLEGVPVHLTAREADVLALMATGLGNRAIADRLFISQNTVAHHVRSILAKVGCGNRTEATAYAVRHGLAGE